VRDLRLAVGDLAPAVADLRSAAPAGRRLVRALLPFAERVKPVAAQLRPFSAGASKSIPSLSELLRQANPLVAYLSPYWHELPVFFAEIGAATKYTDSIGHLGKLALLFGRGSIPGLPPNLTALIQKLNQMGGGLDKLGFNALPAPGEAGQSKTFTGSYPQLRADPPYARRR
jgi:phospholipid/cholesterol/gamma-HCH transport system substrate-binding protein